MSFGLYLIGIVLVIGIMSAVSRTRSKDPTA